MAKWIKLRTGKLRHPLNINRYLYDLNKQMFEKPPKHKWTTTLDNLPKHKWTTTLDNRVILVNVHLGNLKLPQYVRCGGS